VVCQYSTRSGPSCRSWQWGDWPRSTRITPHSDGVGIPHEIRFEAGNRISFVSLARALTVSAADIRSIKPYGGAGGIYVLRYNAGKIRLLSQFSGFNEIVSRIKAANPRFDVVGI
jgi:hypothetical protein